MPTRPTRGLPSTSSKWLHRIWPFSQLAHENSVLREMNSELLGYLGRAGVTIKDTLEGGRFLAQENEIKRTKIKFLKAENCSLKSDKEHLLAEIARWQKIFSGKVPSDNPPAGPISTDPADYVFGSWELAGEGSQPVPDGTPIQAILGWETLKKPAIPVALAEEYRWLGTVLSYRVGVLKSEMSE